MNDMRPSESSLARLSSKLIKKMVYEYVRVRPSEG
jgi:hypothetical protein